MRDRLRRLLAWVLRGSDELIMPATWLADLDGLRPHEEYTRRQLNQGSVVSDVAAMRRRAFWKAVEAKAAAARAKTAIKVIRGGRFQ